MENDRLNFIIRQVKVWRNTDPGLVDKRGFLRHMMSSNYADHSIVRTRLWIKQYDEAKYRGTSVAELLFDKMKSMYQQSSGANDHIL